MADADVQGIMRRSAIAVILLIGGWLFFGDSGLTDGLSFSLRVVGFLVMVSACSLAAIHALRNLKP